VTCYHPLQGYRSKETGPTGKRRVVFNPNHGYRDLPVTLKCGQCDGCRLDYSRQWAIRISHEAQMHAQNSFITLTYADKYLPSNGSLDLRHFQLFMKRLRFDQSHSIRFFHCGEYGTKHRRPHYHACLFGISFNDRYLFKPATRKTEPLYRSPTLENLWTYGHSSVGNLTFKSAAYVARYILKKITGEQAENYYTRIDPETGEITQLKPEYTTMSRRPGLGSKWLKTYGPDVYPSDEIIFGGKRYGKPPRYYDKQYELTYPSDFAKIHRSRVLAGKCHPEDNTPARLRVREAVQRARMTKLNRSYEDDH